MSRLHYLTTLFFIILFAVAANWLLQSINESPVLEKTSQRHAPDYYLENFTASQMNKAGKRAYKVIASYLEHYPDDNSMKLIKPFFSFYENETLNWTVTADEALLLQDSEIIYLANNVVVNQIPNPKEQIKASTLKSQQLTIELKKKLAHTKAKVQLKQGNNTIHATGMRADIAKSKIEFLSRTRSHYVNAQ